MPCAARSDLHLAREILFPDATSDSEALPIDDVIAGVGTTRQSGDRIRADTTKKMVSGKEATRLSTRAFPLKVYILKLCNGLSKATKVVD